MRYTKYTEIQKIIKLMEQIIPSIIDAIELKNYQAVIKTLEECYVSSNDILTVLKLEDNLNDSIQAIESYMMIISSIYLAMESQTILSIEKVREQLVLTLAKFKTSFLEECICEKKEVVFMPYKASMWDALESVWQAACKDKDANVTVVSVPYFDKNPDGTFGSIHDEIDNYPSYVKVTKSEDYNFEVINPDIIFIHNPYDEYNTVTSVDPRFYASNLKNYTKQLIYIPYFVLEEGISTIDSVRHFAKTSGVIHSSKVIVQSDKIRKLYIEALVEEFGETTHEIWSKKIKSWGSPKYDQVQLDITEMPKEWLEKIYKKDGTRKKVILYNTSLAALLQNPQKMLQKIINIFSLFENKSQDICLLWRPHPLMLATLQSMHPQLSSLYEAIVTEYQNKNFGIYDDTANLNRAIALVDAYYGDHGSLVALCEYANKPIMVQNVDVTLNNYEVGKNEY